MAAPEKLEWDRPDVWQIEGIKRNPSAKRPRVIYLQTDAPFFTLARRTTISEVSIGRSRFAFEVPLSFEATEYMADVDTLEEIWWRFHDDRGNLRRSDA